MPRQSRKVEEILKVYPQTFSEELGIDLERGSDKEIFKWFLASILFGARISMEIAKRTYMEFEKVGLVTPDAILSAGWDKLVEVLDAGGYVRYDFSTADDLLDVARVLKEKYGGKLTKVHSAATGPRNLERRIQEFRGVGPTTSNIFLRELRGVWEKADPDLSPLVKRIAKKLGISESIVRRNKKLEAALVRMKKS